MPRLWIAFEVLLAFGGPLISTVLADEPLHFGFGRTVDPAGDLDGDGVVDLLVGAPNYEVGGYRNVGRAYVFSGTTGALLLTLDDPNPEAGARFGWEVAPAGGDVNGDGVPDLLVGAWGQDQQRGRAFVFSGIDGVPLLTLQDPTPQVGSRFGYMIAPAGDINRDGVPDIVVGAPWKNVDGNSNQGQAYVFSGADGTLLFILNNPALQSSADFGRPVAPAGDINRDGVPDIVVGAPLQDVNGALNQGQAFIFSGADGTLLLTLDNPTPGLKANFGRWVAAKDLDGDGVSDFLVGASGQSQDQGVAFVFSGADGILLLTLEDPTPQFHANFGRVVAIAGDVNRDGVPDLLIGAPDQNVEGYRNVGQAFIFSGADGALLRTLNNPLPQAGASFAHTLASAGDINGDGVTDVVVGAPDQDMGLPGKRGQVFIFSGADGALLRVLDDPTLAYAWS